jgi:hypothetical protein
MVPLAALALLLAPVPARAVIEWVPIGDPGNDSDPQPAGSFGSVDYEYSISKFEITNAEYAIFLNAKAASDPLGLYSPSMESDFLGGIVRVGTPGNYSYTVKDGFADKPVNFVTFFDALRFANWLENGEGTAAPRRARTRCSARPRRRATDRRSCAIPTPRWWCRRRTSGSRRPTTTETSTSTTTTRRDR